MSKTHCLKRQGRREGIDAAIGVIERLADRLMRQADKYHDEPDYDRYEQIECEATLLSAAAGLVRRNAMRNIRRDTALHQSEEQ